MEHQQGNNQGMESEANSNQIPYPVNPHQPGPGPVPGQSLNQTTNHLPAFSTQMAQQHQLAYQYNQQQQQQQLHQQLQDMWAKQYQEIEQATDFKNHSLPLARIKKIMKSDEDVRMISAEVPVMFARACEMFIQELTTRAWSHTEENKRRTLQKNDIASAVARTEIFDFLVDVVPPEDLRDEALALLPRGAGGLPGVGDGLPPYYYMPPLPQLNVPPVGAPGMFVGGYGQAWPQQPPPPPAAEEVEDDSQAGSLATNSE